MIEREENLNSQAIILASDGDFTSAIACFKRAITIQQNNGLLWFNLGVTYRDSGDMEKAIQALEKAHKIEPENTEITETLATTYLQIKNLNKAFDLCIEGLDINDNSCNLWNLMGVIFFQREKYSEAAEHFEMAVILNPYYEDALYNLKDTYAELHNKVGQEECENRIKELRK